MSKEINYRSGKIGTTPFCKILLKGDYNGPANCVDVKLSCANCPIAQAYAQNHYLLEEELNKVQSEAMTLKKT